MVCALIWPWKSDSAKTTIMSNKCHHLCNKVHIKDSVVTEDGMTYLFTSADDNNVDDDMMMMMMMCPHVSS